LFLYYNNNLNKFKWWTIE